MDDGTGISCFLSPELLSFWLVLTEAKAGFDSPAADLGRHIPPRAYSCLLPGGTKALHIWRG